MHRRRVVVGLLLVGLCLVGAPVRAADDGAAIDALLSGYAALQQFNGTALVAREGRTVLEKGYGLANMEWGIPNDGETRFRIGSITKQFTATLILQLVAEGTLTLDTTLAEALPGYRADTGARVTIRQLLNHTSGIPPYTDQPAFQREVGRAAWTVDQMIAKFGSGDLEFTPGERFRYNNSGYFLLGAVVERLTGKPYEQALAERILVPLGLKATGYDHAETLIPKRAAGYARTPGGYRNAEFLDMSVPFAAGALYSTARDLYAWDQALYGDRVIPAALKAQMFTPGKGDYGFGWFIAQRPVGAGKAMRTVISHGGGINGFNTLLLRVPEERTTVILLNNTGGTRLQTMADGILDLLHGRTPAPPRRPISEELATTIAAQGVDAAIAQYRELIKGKDPFDAEEAQLNVLGYQLLGEGKADAAIAIFTLNVERFPDSWNVYDSLAEAQAAAGKREDAIRNYARSLEKNPGNVNAVEALAKLTKAEEKPAPR